MMNLVSRHPSKVSRSRYLVSRLRTLILNEGETERKRKGQSKKRQQETVTARVKRRQ